MISQYRNESKHILVQIKTNGIKETLFKDCSSLRIVDPGYNSNNYWLMCEHQSFMALRKGREIVTGCPTDCTCFEDRVKFEEKENKQKRKERRHEVISSIWNFVVSLISAPFQYFAKLPAAVQIMIFLLPIVYFAPKLVDTLIAAYKAVK